MSDPFVDVPREREVARPGAPPSLALLRRRDFRLLYCAVAASELGDALHYIALMWLALQGGGALGVVAVRLADSLPALFFGLHGGIAADRFSRRRLMVGADLVRFATLIPVAVAGLSGSLPLWGLVAAAFVLEAATSYFAPAYGATIPALVGRSNVQQANALVHATMQALSVGGWALAAILLAFVPTSTFFAVNAVTFLVSGLLIARVRIGDRDGEPGARSARLRDGIEALRDHRALTVAVVAYAAAMTITTGAWIAGVPTLVRDTLDEGAGGFSVVMVGFAAGSIAVGAVLTRLPVRAKARGSMLAWTAFLPAYGLVAASGSLALLVAAAVGTGAGETLSTVLLNSAAQEEVPDEVLGRVAGVIAFVHRGSHATGLLLVAPLFAVAAPRPLFAAAACATALVGLVGAGLAARLGS
jgi:MFS family permease